MKQIHQIIILMVAFALFLGCSKDNDETESVLKPEIVVMNLGGAVGDAASIKGKNYIWAWAKPTTALHTIITRTFGNIFLKLKIY